MDKHLKLLSGLMALVMLVSLFPVTAFATKPGEPEAPSEEGTEAGEALSSDSDLVTRDLIFDKAGNKQFITVQDREGNLFYVIIDYDAPVGEEEEQFKTYFLNPVDPADLAALGTLQEERPTECICQEKCGPGRVNMDCPVCAANMAECTGKEPEIMETDAAEPEIQIQPEEPEETNTVAIAGVVIAAAAAAVVLMMKVRKKPGRQEDDPDDYIQEDDPADGA